MPGASRPRRSWMRGSLGRLLDWRDRLTVAERVLTPEESRTPLQRADDPSPPGP